MKTKENIKDISKSEIYKIKELWEELNAIHHEDSVYFKDFYETFSFGKRMKHLETFPDDDIKISVVETGGKIMGYCISSVNGSAGEIESLYLRESVRKMNYGRELVDLHKGWLQSKNCTKIKVTVSFGHDSVLKFYNKMGFFERKTELELK
jgi:ribosomal protein S18 acetylase RimI-like enzyme